MRRRPLLAPLRAVLLLSLTLSALLFTTFAVVPFARADEPPPPLDWSLLLDPSATSTIADVAGPLSPRFTPLGLGNPGYVSGAVWVRLRIHNASPHAETRVVDPCRAWMDDVRFYVHPSGSLAYSELRSGALIPFADRPFPHERSILRVTTPPGATDEVFIRISGSEPIALEPRALELSKFEAQDGLERFWLGAFLGIVLAIAIYQAALYSALRDPSHPVLGAMLLLYALAEASIHGLVGRFVPPIVPLLPRVIPALFAMAMALLFRLTSIVLGASSVQLARRLAVVQWVYLAIAACALVTPASNRLVFSSVALSLPVCLVAGLSQRRVLGSTARLYILAVTAFILPTFLPVLELLGAFPLRSWTENGAHVGAILLALLLSLTVADRIARLHEGALRFVPWAFLEQLGRRDLSQVVLGDCVEATMTVLFSDIRAFTSRSESLTARQTFEFLNEYMGRVVPSLRAHGGFVDKYIGDAVMALFAGSPDHALRAAIEMQRVARGNDAVEIGVALHTGPMMLGIIGEPQRMEATVISDTVNVTSRLESLTKQYGARVLVTAELVARLERPADFHLRRLGRAPVRGRTASVDLLELLDAETAPVLARRLATLTDFHAAIDALDRGDHETARDLAARIAEADPSDGAARWLMDLSPASRPVVSVRP